MIVKSTGIKAGSLLSQGLKLVDCNSLLIWSKMVKFLEIQFLLHLVIVVPNGSEIDHTRPASNYDPTCKYLVYIGFQPIET